MKIAFFGAGLMGAGFVRRMLDKGQRGPCLEPRRRKSEGARV